MVQRATELAAEPAARAGRPAPEPESGPAVQRAPAPEPRPALDSAVARAQESARLGRLAQPPAAPPATAPAGAPASAPTAAPGRLPLAPRIQREDDDQTPPVLPLPTETTPTPPQPMTRARSNAITQRPPTLTAPEPEPDNSLWSELPFFNAPPEWQKAQPRSTDRTGPQTGRELPLAIGRHRAPAPDSDTGDDESDTETGEPKKKSDKKEKAPPVDLERLARDVLPYLKHMMLVERERHTRR
jgi:hypothetical protein